MKSRRFKIFLLVVLFFRTFVMFCHQSDGAQFMKIFGSLYCTAWSRKWEVGNFKDEVFGFVVLIYFSVIQD